MTQKEATTDQKKYLQYLTAAVGTLVIGNPIELVKTRIQTSSEHIVKGSINKPYASIWQTFGRVIKEEHIQGLFKGVGYFILRTIPPNIGIFTIKELIHSYLTDYIQNGQNRIAKTFVEQHYFMVNSLIGGIAGFIIQVCIYPFQYFRVVISNEVKSQPQSGIAKCIKEAFQHRGVYGIFNGVSMNLAYMTSIRAIYFGMFDSFKGNTSNEHLKFIWSYISISAALLITYPIDTVRKRVIVAPQRYRNGRACLQYMIQNETLSEFYRGWRIVSLLSISFSSLLYVYDLMFSDIFGKNKQKEQ